MACAAQSQFKNIFLEEPTSSLEVTTIGWRHNDISHLVLVKGNNALLKPGQITSLRASFVGLLLLILLSCLTRTAPEERSFQLQISLLWHKEKVGSLGTLQSLCGFEQPVE